MDKGNEWDTRTLDRRVLKVPRTLITGRVVFHGETAEPGKRRILITNEVVYAKNKPIDDADIEDTENVPTNRS